MAYHGWLNCYKHFPPRCFGMGSCFWVGCESMDGRTDEEMSIMTGYEMDDWRWYKMKAYWIEAETQNVSVPLEASPVYTDTLFTYRRWWKSRSTEQFFFSLAFLMLGYTPACWGESKGLWCIDIDVRTKHVAFLVGHSIYWGYVSSAEHKTPIINSRLNLLNFDGYMWLWYWKSK
jgi:hypothetical protein